MPRIWFSGPRILGGLVRPGISFNVNELYAKPRGSRSPAYGRDEALEDVKAIVLRETGTAIDDVTADF